MPLLIHYEPSLSRANRRSYTEHTRQNPELTIMTHNQYYVLLGGRFSMSSLVVPRNNIP